MIELLQRYSKYKDASATWFGAAPTHWELKRVKNMAKLKSGDTITAERINDTGPFPVFGGNGFRGYTRAYTHEGRYILIGRQGALCGNVNYAKGKFWASEHAVVVLPRVAFEPHWFGELLRTMNLNQYSIAAAQPGLAVERIGSLYILVPPLAEQAAIAKYVDHVDQKINRYIRGKKKLIALLNEQKQAIIHKAVTRGLDPSVKLRSSGVEWLGDLPEQWEVRPAKFFFREVDERSVSGSEELLSVSHKTGVTPRSQKNVTMFLAASNIGHKLCRPGDIVINTMWAWMAALGVSRYTGLVSPSYGVYRPKGGDTGLLDKFTDELLRIELYRAEYVRRSTGVNSSRLRLYPEEFLRIPLVVPPGLDQMEIVRFIEERTADLDHARASATKEIALLHEYRARLIDHVVTGKLDVREAAAKLPEVTEEPATLDEIEDMAEDEALADPGADEEAEAA